jgi:O-antigen/teichoic acid export membrane protein
VTPIITAPYISRVLGADGVGVYSYTSSIVTYFTMFAAMGTVSYGTKEIASCRDDKQLMSKTFWEIEIMTLCTTAISLIGFLLLILFSGEYKIYFLCLIPTLLATAADISWLYTGVERVHFTVIWNMICKILGVAFIFIFIKSKDDLALYIFIMSIITMFGNISMWMFLPKVVVRTSFKEFSIFRHFKQTLKYFITSVAISIYTVLDKTMIGLLTDDSFENGYYEQATKIINMVKPFAFMAINEIMTPRMSYLFANNQQDEIKIRIEKSLNIELLLTFGCVFGIIAVADVFVPLFFGDGYDSVILLLRVMAPILIPICLSTCAGSHYYVPSGNVMKGTRWTIVGAVINLAINAPLIIYFGALGAIIASLVAETTIGVLYVVMSKGYVNILTVLKVSWKKLIAGAVMCAVVIYLGYVLSINTILILLIQVISGIAIYGILLLVLRDKSIVELIISIKKRILEKCKK